MLSAIAINLKSFSVVPLHQRGISSDFIELHRLIITEMPDFKQQYKNPRLGFGDVSHNRNVRAYKQDKSRKNVRMRAFDQNRQLQNDSEFVSSVSENVSPVKDKRMKKLIKWREERDRKKKLQAAKKKPVFKVGIVHHSLCSPWTKNHGSSEVTKSPKQMKHQNDIPRRITRATEKRLLAKTTLKQVLPKNAVLASIPKPRIDSNIRNLTNKKEQKSFAPSNHAFRPPSGLPKMPLFGLVPAEQTPYEKGDFFIKDKSTECKMPDNIKNNETDNVLDKLHVRISDIKKSTMGNKISSSPKSSRKKKSVQKSNGSVPDSNTTPGLKKVMEASNKVDRERDPAQEEKSLSDNSDTKKPLKKAMRTSNKINIERDTAQEEKSLSDNSDTKKPLKKAMRTSNKINRERDPVQEEKSLSDNSDTKKPLKKAMRTSNKTNIERDPAQEEKSLSDNSDTKKSQEAVSVESIVSADAQGPLDTGPLDKESFDTENLIAFSPYLTLSRGKKNARKERQQRLGIGHSPSDEIPTKDTVMKSLNISVEDEERTAQYFKFLLNKETDRLQGLCNKWLDIQLEQGVPDDAVYEINQAMGQTNLLINKKFKRFRSLVQDCETGRGEMLVTCRDLQGFWDMTYMEVNNCEARFEKLEQRRNRQWQEEECTVNVFVTKKKRMPAKKQIASSKPSSLRSLILASRKRKIETETSLPDKEDSLSRDTGSKEPVTSSSSRKSMTRKEKHSVRRTRSRSFGVNEYKSTPVRTENSKVDSMQKTHFSSASKKLKSPYTIMKISQMCKTPEVQLDDTIAYINSGQTPAKSILKRLEEPVNKEARVRSAHKVNFDDEVVLAEMPLDEEAQTRLSLAAALNRINDLDLDELSVEDSINAGKKLNFEDCDSSLTFDEFAAKVRTKLKKHRSRSPIQNSLDADVYSRNDVALAASFKETSLSDREEVIPRKSSRQRTLHVNISDKEAEHINVLLATPLKTNVKTPVISGTMSNLKIEEDTELEVKILRNRTVTTNDIVKINRTSKAMTPKRQSASKKENKSPMKANRKSSLKLSQKDGKRYMTPATTEMENIVLDVDKRRKSSRKSVAFNVETCFVCAENKPVLPMTPHSKRQSKTSRSSRSKRTLNEDLISWETPERPPRITRSYVKTN